jgi:hypothetical protein
MTQTDFPIGQNFSEKELKERFHLIKDMPYNNPELAYKILIPKGWESESIQAESKDLNPNTLKPLGIFKGPEDGGANPFVQIQAVQLLREITAANWLRHYAIATERELLAIKPISDRFADSVMEFSIQGHPFTARVTASIDGDRLFFLFNLALASTYPKYEEIFGVPVVSFNLQKMSGKPSIENRLSYNLNDIIRFTYPESWKYRAVTEKHPKGREAADLFSFDPDGNLCGRMRVKTVDKGFSSGVEEQIEDTLSEYGDGNVIVDDLLESVEVEIGSDRFDTGVVKAFSGHIEGNEIRQEVWVAVIEDPKYYMVVSLLTPFREQGFYLWAINRRAYDIVLETLA